MLLHCNGMDLYDCPGCNKKFSKRKGVINHIEDEHKKEIKKLKKDLQSFIYLYMIRQKSFFYIFDFTSIHGIENYLMNGYMCWICLRFPKNEKHKCLT